jgi:hypothetical protein
MNFFYTLLLIIIGFTFINRFKKNLSKTELLVLRRIWIFHILVSVGFYFFTRNGGGDAWYYFITSQKMNFIEFWNYLFNEKGTYFVFALNYIPSKILGLNFFNNTLLHSFLGFIGMVYFYLTALKTIHYNTKIGKFFIFPLFFFLPNLHFWSSGVGKDSLLFFCIGMFTYALLSIKKRSFLIVISLGFAFFIRPHMVLFLLFSFGLAYLFHTKIGSVKRFFFTGILIVGSIFILPAVLEFVKVEEISTESIVKFSEDKSALLSREETGSRLSQSSSFPSKLFAFYFRPFFFDVNGLPALIASFENLLLVLLSIKVLRNKPYLAFKKAPFVIKGLFLFMLIGSIAFSLSLGNVGIMIRMRNMFLPGFIIFMMWTLSYAHERKLKSQNKHS